MDGGRGRELGALVELCRELARLDLTVGLSDARPAVSVRDGLGDRKLWIEVDSDGRSFVWWRNDRDAHALGDPAGAAARIAEYLKGRGQRPGERP